MKHLVLLILFITLLTSLLAQNISRQVFSNMGGSYQGSGFQATWTVGETIISSMSSGNLLANQGFQQPPCFNDSSSLSATVVDSYTWNGSSYTSSGTYIHTYLNADGCDSVVTLNLIVYHTTVTMILQNVVQISPSIFQYDVILSNTGNTTLGLQGYTCGINHATGMRNGGTLTHTFLSRDTLLSALSGVTAAYTASTNHLRFITANVSAGNEYIMTPGTSIRLATMRVSNSVPFPVDFVPALNLQSLIAIGKTPCVATCIATPPGTSYAINGTGNNPSAGTLQGLTGIVNTPCLSLNSTASFNASGTQTTSITCSALVNIAAEITLNGIGSSSFPGTYTLDGGQSISYSTNPFSLNNLTEGTHTVAVASANGCTSSTLFSITQGILDSVSVSVIPNPIICQGDSIILYAIGANSINWSDPLVNNGIGFLPSSTQTYTVTGTNSFGCTATSQVTVTVNPRPTAYLAATGPISFCNGNSVVLNANGGNGLTYQWYHTGNPIAGATSNSLQVNQSGNYWVEETNQYACSSVSSTQTVTVNDCDVHLDLKLFYQGYYTGMSTMAPALLNEGVSVDPTVTDTILIELHSPLPPYGLVISKKAILHTDGHALCAFDYYANNYYIADSYYVAIRHRNGLTTWSSNPILFDSTAVTYDFTTASSKAYGENMIEVEPGIWTFYAGELNYDENIDLLDNSILEYDVANFFYGYYKTDINGDGNSDLLDVPVLEMNIYSFIYSSQPTWSGILPSVNTNPVTSITAGTAVSGGNILSDGGALILQKGVCWSMNPQPTIADNKTMDGSGVGSFTSNLTMLNPTTTYYVRSYAMNSVGTIYGNEVSFVSGPLAIGQSYQGGIVAYLLQSGDPGYVVGETKGIIAAPFDQGTADWGCPLQYIGTSTDFGTGETNTNTIVNGCSSSNIAANVCYNLILNGYSDWFLPSKDELNKLYLNRSIIGPFSYNFYWSSSELSNSDAWNQNFVFGYQYYYYKNTQSYSIRAIRYFSDVNTVGVTTTPASSITLTNTTCGGSIFMLGSSPVTARGVCWSTNPNPTVSLSTKTIDGSGTGTFASNITGLNPGTTYHVRAYATTSTGTVYGNDISFTTLSLSIGDSYGGGKVAYILEPGDNGYIAGEQHGLIVSSDDLSTTSEWWNGNFITTGANGISLGTGYSNTIAIVNSQGGGSYAAEICYSYTTGVYSDWYLPSRGELYKLYFNRITIGLGNYNFWSSSEFSQSEAWYLAFWNGNSYNATKSYPSAHVRAVRSF